MHSEKAWLENLLLFCLLCTLLLLPAVLNGLPFLSADTASYLRVGAGIAGLFERALTSSEADVLLTAGRPVSPEEVRIGASYLAVRSPWYSFVAGFDPRGRTLGARARSGSDRGSACPGCHARGGSTRGRVDASYRRFGHRLGLYPRCVRQLCHARCVPRLRGVGRWPVPVVERAVAGAGAMDGVARGRDRGCSAPHAWSCSDRRCARSRIRELALPGFAPFCCQARPCVGPFGCACGCSRDRHRA